MVKLLLKHGVKSVHWSSAVHSSPTVKPSHFLYAKRLWLKLVGSFTSCLKRGGSGYVCVFV